MARSDGVCRPAEVLVRPWIRDLTVLRQVAVNAGNTTLVEMTDHACSMRDEFELKAVKQLYVQEYPDDELGHEVVPFA